MRKVITSKATVIYLDGFRANFEADGVGQCEDIDVDTADHYIDLPKWKLWIIRMLLK